MNKLNTTLQCAQSLDSQDPLNSFRSKFIFPKDAKGNPVLYFTGNSLGLQPVEASKIINNEINDWAKCAIEGFWKENNPWLTYHDYCAQGLAKIVGAQASEVVAMNSLTVNLHLMMVSFYRPTKSRYKILIESGAFPSDQYAVASQASFHGFNPEDAILELTPRDNEDTLRQDDIIEFINKNGSEIALIMLGGINYRTGQAFDMKSITEVGHKNGCVVGFDLAHGAGNLELSLHDWNVDFAVWCNYKYINAGPGAVGGCFVHQRHITSRLPRFEGWWGHDLQTRFKMPNTFKPILGAEAWQLSTAPVLQLASLRSSIEIFNQTSMKELRKKSLMLTGYLEFLLNELIPAKSLKVITPAQENQRGCQLSLRLSGDPRSIQKELLSIGIVTDFREPDVIRVAPAPLYNSFEDVFKFVDILSKSEYV